VGDDSCNRGKMIHIIHRLRYFSLVLSLVFETLSFYLRVSREVAARLRGGGAHYTRRAFLWKPQTESRNPPRYCIAIKPIHKSAPTSLFLCSHCFTPRHNNHSRISLGSLLNLSSFSSTLPSLNAVSHVHNSISWRKTPL